MLRRAARSKRARGTSQANVIGLHARFTSLSKFSYELNNPRILSHQVTGCKSVHTLFKSLSKGVKRQENEAGQSPPFSGTGTVWNFTSTDLHRALSRRSSAETILLFAVFLYTAFQNG